MTLRNWLILAVVATALTLGAMSVFGPRTPAPDAPVLREDPASSVNDSLEAAAAHILIAHVESDPPIEGVTRSRAEARELAMRLYVKATGPTHAFADLAREFSDDPRAARTGGYLGILPRGRLPLGFEVPLFDLEPGQVYPAAETKQGYHVIKRLHARRYEAQHVMITWKDSEATAVRATRTKNQARLLADEVLAECLRDGADFCDIAARFSDDNLSRFECGTVGMIEPAMTDPAFEDALFKLDVGELSAVVETPFGYHIIRRTK